MAYAGRADRGLADILSVFSTPVDRLIQDDPNGPVDPEAFDLLKAVNGWPLLPSAVRVLMDDYVHDSRSGFLEPRSVAKSVEEFRAGKEKAFKRWSARPCVPPRARPTRRKSMRC